MINNLF